MDFEDLFKLLPLLLWALSRVIGRRRKGSETSGETPAAERAPSPQDLAQRGAAEVGELEARGRAALGSLDEPSRRTFEAWLGERIGSLGARRTRLAALAEAGDAELDEVVRVGAELDPDRTAIAALTDLAARRRAAPSLQSVADALLDQLYSPLEPVVSERAAGPARPVSVVGADERLLRSPLRPALVAVPASVGTRPWLWPLLGAELGRYLLAALPGFTGEIEEALELDTGGEALRPDSVALAKLLFAAWSDQLVADLTATSLFGSAWLEMMVREAGADGDAHAATGIGLDGRGGLLPRPPDHVRVLLAAHWLSSMGDESAALEWSRRWNDAHGDPASLHFPGSRAPGAIPLEPLASHLRRLVERFDSHAFRALGGSRFAGLPGLSDWNSLSGLARRAARELDAGTPARVPARALVAAATSAAIAAPHRAAEIHAALADSLAGRARTPVARPTPRAAPPRRTRLPRRVAEALILSELVEPRAR